MHRMTSPFFKKLKRIRIFEGFLDLIFSIVTLHFFLIPFQYSLSIIALYIIYILIFMLFVIIYQITMTRQKLKYQVITICLAIILTNSIFGLILLIKNTQQITIVKFMKFIGIQLIDFLILKIINRVYLKRAVTREVLVLIDPNDEHAIYHVIHNLPYYIHVKDMRVVTKYDQHLQGIHEVYNMSSKYIYDARSQVRMINYHTIDEITIRNVAYKKTTGAYFVIKRALDIFFGILGVIIFLIPMILIAIIIKIQDGGPILFRQDRYGKSLEAFRILKFRTMNHRSQSSRRAIYNDSRVTPFGKLLRATKLDELPQFFHLITGKMSLVGPRPYMCQMVLEETERDSNFELRSKVKPGITGLTQVLAYFGTREERLLKLDLIYIENLNLFYDVYICLWTIPAIVNRMLMKQERF